MTFTQTRTHRLSRACLRAAVLFAMAAGVSRADTNQEARQILEATGIKGGVVVHAGCGNGELTAALRASDSYVVQGLDRDPKNVEAARRHVRSLGVYGKVTIDRLDGDRLPLIDDFANLVVSGDLGGIAMDEVQRVLAPNGVAYIKTGDGWTKTVKPRPREMDEWTHYLRDPSNNAVAHDTLIGPPRRMQWLAGPRYSRHHDHMSAISAMVSANGRNFYIFDEGLKASILVPPDWYVVARDAFNGALLWKKPIAQWHTNLWPLKSGPQILTRRLVAVGERVFVTLGIDAPVSVLDAATGAVIRTCEGTRATEEMLFDDGMLIVVAAADGQPLRSDPNKALSSLSQIKAMTTDPLWTEAPRTIIAIDADSGRTLWKRQTTVAAMSLAAGGGRVLYHDGEKIQCLDRASGDVRWSSAPLKNQDGMRSSGGVTLVLYKDVVLYGGQIPAGNQGKGATLMYGLSAEDGKTLWEAEHPPCGHAGTPVDLLVVDGLLWTSAVANSTDSGETTGRDPRTGKIVKQFPCDADVPWFHHRCYRGKATDNYLMFSRTGIEYLDIRNSHWTPNNWVRSGCLYGVMPANGMTYTNPHPCACYEETKLYGFAALAPQAKTPIPAPGPDESRLEKGPAYGTAFDSKLEAPNPADWPTYRCDMRRSGATKTPVDPDLTRLWRADLGAPLSSVVVAEGKLFVASLDTCAVHALDANTGAPVWTYTPGGRVDSPPTIWQGRALFGCADGWVYCLRASDGALIWRFRAAPLDRRLMSFEQIESVWPVPGAVLVRDGVAYCVAGRSMFLDGGLRMLRLDVKTGRKLSETVMNDLDPSTNENLQSKAKSMNMPVGLPDILSSDERYVYMRSLPFDLEGKRKFVEYVPVKEQKGDDVHLFSPTGFLDNTMWHRTYWVYGRAWASGAGGYFQAGRVAPSGRLMVFDEDTVWGYGRSWQYYRWSTPYVNHLFATPKQPEILTVPRKPEAKATSAPDGEKRKKRGTSGQIPTSRFAWEWSDELPVQVCAMALAGTTLFVAGPPEVVNEEEAAKTLGDSGIREKLAEQGEAYKGRKGAILSLVSASDGKGLASFRLDSMPVFDGMIAAGGRIYLSASDGSIQCLGAGAGRPLPPASDVVAKPRPNLPLSAQLDLVEPMSLRGLTTEGSATEPTPAQRQPAEAPAKSTKTKKQARQK